jgi:hypothetical protein
MLLSLQFCHILPGSGSNVAAKKLFYEHMDEQVARLQLGQHWFITEYIAAYIQRLCTVYKDARVQAVIAHLT